VRRISLIVLLLCLVFSLTAAGEDLWKVSVNNQGDAEVLRATGIEPIMIVRGGYLVLAGPESSAQLEKGSLKARRIATDIEK